MNKYVYSVNNERISVDPKLLINDLKPGIQSLILVLLRKNRTSLSKVPLEAPRVVDQLMLERFLKKCAPPVLGFQIYLLSKSACY